MGRIFKLINTKKLATHDNIVQVMIIGCLGWEREKEQDQRKLALRSYMFSVPVVKYCPLHHHCVAHLWSLQGCQTLGSLVPGAQRVRGTILF